MARILGVEIPGNKPLIAALPVIYGIGRSRAKLICEQAELNPQMRAKDLTNQQINRIIQVIEENGFVIEGDLRREVQQNIKRLQSIRCYRGLRHIRGLPVRGQRTSTNARTRKGPRKTIGVVRRKEAKKGKV
ncbi:30S ribosomal protein S13 [Candidatus Methylacidiphilum fumarolicum]|jgi:small subunit ribosomal protein S13|uniref:Small ribosomal subunit protein uS13 n=3 Tax=Methylacidiphilum (ex Ratnadevi et al. 2023) TaxID=511745 RepID=A0A0C1UUA6_9BACT|nr:MULTISPECIES: 30S ribosomal protein S13 [Methylacidiphilum (ex Ratnadevi et al. 2023)]KIE59348.1 30S ribosomal protein S13 [Methylacidiphilum kamchatkense Kam1]MBW6415662.1 30S ribosomal protein S13 [Candidatus Methylacidiphilum fumarolicum]QDQ42680.1 small subunit ribosomal protein S13 [Methylacidiphilum kamchatkense Kam1]TFE65775.1 30S ribosomal protein S13 [Methylacidiphilum sp. Yel]TFE66800.1 30S ribosomal protein S13 [Candidatus Methylacidiphilum fumarolicum]